MSEAPARKIIRASAVRERTGKSRTQIWRDVRDEKFPAPIQIGPGAIGFYEDEINAWIASRPRVSYAPSPEASAG